MKKQILSLLFLFATQGILFAQSERLQKNYKSSENATLKDAFPIDYEKVTPGCLSAKQLKDLKIFLKNKWNTNLDSIKTLHFYFSNNEYTCNYVKENKFFVYKHCNTVTSIYKPILYVKSESLKTESFWKEDNLNYFFNLFLKDFNTKFSTASITINSKGIYLVDFEVFNPIVFNAFSNEIDTFRCE